MDRWTHIKVLLAIARCRTAALGGHIDECTRCGHRATISYNSCRNRHCPECQTGARERWIQARRSELLPSPYVHVVFTLPSQLAALALQNKKIVYGLLLRASAETLLEVGRNPRRLGAEIGFFSVLHTWNQKIQIHPDVHCVVPAGGLSLDRTRWIRSHPRFFLPIPVLRKVFRSKFVAALKLAFQRGQLHLSGDLALLAQPKFFAAWLRPLFAQKLGGLRETTLRRPRVCAPLSGPLHPPRRHLQPSTGLVGRRPSHLSLAGLGANFPRSHRRRGSYRIMAQQLNKTGEKTHAPAWAPPVGSDIEYTNEIRMLKGMEGRREL
jgi:Transposase zinc-binding domain/Putative transposase